MIAALRWLGWFGLTASLLAVPPSAKSTNLSGTWKGSFTLVSTGLALQDLTITLKQEAGKVEGTLLMPKFRAPIPLKGTCAKGRLRLASPPTRGLTVTLEAPVKGSNEVRGIAVLDYDSPSLNKKQDRTVLRMVRQP
ncbi:MAG: hypothetical protein LWX11_01665 [Firmicutes bacterium]|nr:hypothetical protein [Bacillota bacterium]